MTTLASIGAAQRRYTARVAEIDQLYVDALAERDDVVRAAKAGNPALTQKLIAEEMGVHESRVGQILAGVPGGSRRRGRGKKGAASVATS